MTPLHVFQAIVAKAASEAARGSLQIASTAEALAALTIRRGDDPDQGPAGHERAASRRLIYTINGGVQQVSTNGGAFSGAGAFYIRKTRSCRPSSSRLAAAVVVGGATNPSAAGMLAWVHPACAARMERAFDTKAQVGASSGIHWCRWCRRSRQHGRDGVNDRTWITALVPGWRRR